MGWKWKDEEHQLRLSRHTRVYETNVADGRAYVHMGSIATRYEWFVMELSGLGQRDVSRWVLVTRAGSIMPRLRWAEFFERGSDQVHPDYVEEKFPGASHQEYVEIAEVMIPFLVKVLDMAPIERGSPKEWTPRD